MRLQPTALSAASCGSARRALEAGCAEDTLGTSGFVFFYAAPFRFPRSGCGLLFTVELEEDHSEAGVATPFDSGGLVSVLIRGNQAESARDFLSRHGLPIPGHRDYMRESMTILFNQPVDYLEGRDPRWPGPIGLTGGDGRRWTHEVRIPNQVHVRTSRLQAAFARKALVTSQPPVWNLFRWCEIEGYDFVTFDTPRGNDFATLQRECIEYIRKKLVSSSRV